MQNDWRDLIKPKTVEFDEKEVTPSYGKFSAEPLERGYGITVGNALRRILLSTLPGYAITAVRIKNVLHEFSTLAGVKEDVTDIVLNLKEIRLRLHEGEQITATLKVKGEAQVTARDITGGPSLEVLTPDKHIASLDKGADLDMELVIKRGRGYVPGERTEDEEAIGTIRLDAIFSPIRKVNFTVTNARVGQRTDYDRLTLDVTTDGSIDPRDAIGEAAEILIRQLAIFTDLDAIEGLADAAAAAEQAEAPLAHGMENFPIEELELGVRSYNCLKRVGIETIGDLVSKTENELAAIPNFGKKSIEEVKETLAAHGLNLRGSE
jgi:DNA-directed RNA polymerase subunit alpha